MDPFLPFKIAVVQWIGLILFIVGALALLWKGAKPVLVPVASYLLTAIGRILQAAGGALVDIGRKVLTL